MPHLKQILFLKSFSKKFFIPFFLKLSILSFLYLISFKLLKLNWHAILLQFNHYCYSSKNKITKHKLTQALFVPQLKQIISSSIAVCANTSCEPKTDLSSSIAVCANTSREPKTETELLDCVDSIMFSFFGFS